MAIICPTVMASSIDDFRSQMELAIHLSKRIQVDITDGKFAKAQTVATHDLWWPNDVLVDVHMMFERPIVALPEIMKLKPHMVIIHAESDGEFDNFVKICQKVGVKVGVAVLPTSPVDRIFPSLNSIDHVMIFSGNLGEFGGTANLSLLDRVHDLKMQKPTLEVGWDGGVTDMNARRLAAGGVDVLNVGGFIQKSEHPEESYDLLQSLIVEL